MAKVKVRVLKAVVDNKHQGEVLEVDEYSAKMLIKNGYVEAVNPSKDTKTPEAAAKALEKEKEEEGVKPPHDDKTVTTAPKAKATTKKK